MANDFYGHERERAGVSSRHFWSDKNACYAKHRIEFSSDQIPVGIQMLNFSSLEHIGNFSLLSLWLHISSTVTVLMGVPVNPLSMDLTETPGRLPCIRPVTCSHHRGYLSDEHRELLLYVGNRERKREREKYRIGQTECKMQLAKQRWKNRRI